MIRVLLLLLFFICDSNTFAESCLGRGTVFIYGNGMFNSREDAENGDDAFYSEIVQKLRHDRNKEIKHDLAYKPDTPALVQLVQVAAQKGIDDFENFWLWLGTVKDVPPWFQEAMKNVAVEEIGRQAIAFDAIEDHFDIYSKYLKDGYNVVLVSHSQGNFYANQAMKKLAGYVDENLSDSIAERQAKNPLFPKFLNIFANVQVATPVSSTVNSSPWSTFKDDLVIELVRRKVGALPANLTTAGIGLPPKGDFLGHSFLQAYLRSNEGSRKILDDVQAEYAKLSFPIDLREQAVLLETRRRYNRSRTHPSTLDTDLHFRIEGPSRDEIGSLGDRRPSPDEIVDQEYVSCFNLPLGASRIRLSVYIDEDIKEQFQDVTFDVWTKFGAKDGPRKVSFKAKKGTSYWEVGVIETQKGSDKEPLQVKVDIYPRPKPGLRF